MHILCQQDGLAHALATCAALCRTIPTAYYVTLHGRAPKEGRDGAVDVFLCEERSGIGVKATIPAEIVEAGQVIVPARQLSRVLKSMPQGQVCLSSVMVPDPGPVSEKELVKPLKGGPALQIEGTGQMGTRRRTRLRLRVPQPTPATFLSLTEWQERHIPLATMAPEELRETLKPCLLLARERAKSFADTSEMDHAQILFRFDPQALVCTATTHFAVVQSTLPWVRISAAAPCLHALVDERTLRWIKTALKGETHPVTLMLVPQTAPAILLLFSLPHCTLMCRGQAAPIPLVWEQRIDAPSAYTLLLSRELLLQAFESLSTGRTKDSSPYISLSVVDQHLCLQWDPLAQAEHSVQCQIPLINMVADVKPVCIHLQQTRRMLHKIVGPMISLEGGTIMSRQKRGTTVEPVPIGFVRFSQPANRATQFMLATAERLPEPAGRDISPAHASDTQDEAQKGTTLATI